MLSSIQEIIAVGSIDGVLTTAALLRRVVLSAHSDWQGAEDRKQSAQKKFMEEVGLTFCQPFTVDKVDVEQLAHKEVAFIDLAVNSRDPEMTKVFVQRLHEAGCLIHSVVDEHGRGDWQKILGERFRSLYIQPESQSEGIFGSSGAIFIDFLGKDSQDEHTKELCLAADAADRMNFSTHFGGVVNKAVKSSMMDDSRRVYLARHFAFNRDPDEKILGWIAEYQEILRNHEEIVGAREELGNGIVRVVTFGRKIDMTTFMKDLFRMGYCVALVEGEAFVPQEQKKIKVMSFGCDTKANPNIDLVAAIRGAGIETWGFAGKANVFPDDEEAALVAVRAALK